MNVLSAVDQALNRLRGATRPPSLVVAFSGGPDSTALLHALTQRAPAFGARLHAAHLDHGMDSGSARRAERAAQVADQLGVPLTTERREVDNERESGESREVAARRIRYDFLRSVARDVGARFIATAHHADDQRETVLLRIRFGSGLAGLAGIPAIRDGIVRPLLDVDRLAIESYLAAHAVEPLDDPSNEDLGVPRNVIRHRLLPALRATNANVDAKLISLARTAAAAVSKLDRIVSDRLRFRASADALAFDRRAFERLPDELRAHAVAAACRMIKAPPPTRAALADLLVQLERGSKIGCDLGSGWRLSGEQERLELGRTPASQPPFAYTLKVPGEILLEEASLVFRLTRRSVEPWMFRGSRWRAGMALQLAEGEDVTVRSRRPGDRLQPLGCSYRRRLKDILIDRKMPRNERDRLPILCVGGKIVWVPGITIDESVRLRDANEAWVAEVETAQEST